MTKQKKLATVLALSAAMVLAGCAEDIAPINNGDESDAGNGGPDLTVKQHADGYNQGLVDASASKWVYVDLETMTQTFPENPDADDVWDVAFEAAAIKVNGGVSGAPPTAQEVYIYADKVADDVDYPWDNLSNAPAFDSGTWQQDESGAGSSGNPNDEGDEPTYVFSTYPSPDQDPGATVCGDYGWYYYNFFCASPNHATVPRVNVAYVIRSTDCRYYRFRMTDYFNDAGLSKFPQFDLEEIPGDACESDVPGNPIDFPEL